MKAVGQGMDAMKKALIGMIWILDLPMTQNQWMRLIAIPSDMCNNEFNDDQNDDHEDERVVLANLKLDIDENRKIQKQLKNVNTTLTQELKECKSILKETSRTLGESNST
nr:hypothetical protein [Tanacetum cinerariifolium]GEZ85064.1 hypothetical protein [Tanacetum cinerariifolium]